MKSGGPGGAGFLGCFSWPKKSKTCGSYLDNFAPVEIFLCDETPILGVLPNGKSRAGRAPDFDHFVVGSFAACQPFEEIKYQWVDDSVGHGLFRVPHLHDSAMTAQIHAAGHV
jgi:hypothetical protein